MADERLCYGLAPSSLAGRPSWVALGLKSARDLGHDRGPALNLCHARADHSTHGSTVEGVGASHAIQTDA